jgi:hypothetical protein
MAVHGSDQAAALTPKRRKGSRTWRSGSNVSSQRRISWRQVGAPGRYDSLALSVAWMVARIVLSIASVGTPGPRPCTASRNAPA